MEEEILKLLYDYSLKGRIVDKKFIEKIIEIITLKRSLTNQVLDLKIEDTQEDLVLATYKHKEKIVVFYKNNINKMLELLKKYDCLFTDFEKILYRNVFIIETILHEMEHAYQMKIINDLSNCNIDARLLRETFNEDCLNEEIYLKYYRVIPLERLAEFNSWFTMVNILKSISKKVSSLYEFTATVFIEECLRGYEDNNPSEEYFKSINKTKFYESIKKELEKSSLRLRVMYGMPIDLEEKHKLVRCLKTSNKYNAKNLYIM